MTKELLRSLIDSMTRDELLELIISIDAKVGHWPFTTKLFAHFSALDRVRQIERQIDSARSSDTALRDWRIEDAS